MIENLTQSDTVTFSVSVNTCTTQDTFTFDQLGIELSDYETGAELDNAIDEMYLDWLHSSCNQSYWISKPNQQGD